MLKHGRFIFYFCCAALAWWFIIWMLSVGLEKAAFDAVNG